MTKPHACLRTCLAVVVAATAALSAAACRKDEVSPPREDGALAGCAPPAAQQSAAAAGRAGRRQGLLPGARPGPVRAHPDAERRGAAQLPRRGPSGGHAAGVVVRPAGRAAVAERRVGCTGNSTRRAQLDRARLPGAAAEEGRRGAGAAAHPADARGDVPGAVALPGALRRGSLHRGAPAGRRPAGRAGSRASARGGVRSGTTWSPRRSARIATPSGCAWC